MARIKMSTSGAERSPPLYAAKPSASSDVQERMTAHGRLEELKSAREPYLRRGRQASALSIPSLLPPEGHNGSSDLPTPWAAVAAKCVLNLSAKLLMTLFPAGQPCHKTIPSRKIVEQLRAKFPDEQGGPSQQFIDAKTELLGEFANQEQDVADSLESDGYRPVLSEGLKQIIAVGNVLVDQTDPSGKVAVHRLDKYAVCRDGVGNVVDLVLEQSVDKRALPRHVRAIYEAFNKDDENQKKSREVRIYTWVQRDEYRAGKYNVHQEICGQIIPGTDGSWPAEAPGLFPVAINRIPGEDYGRGQLEMYLGDFASYDGLSQSLIQGVANLVRMITLVDEGGQTQKRELEAANNGDFLDGKKDDVHVVQSEKAFDLQVARVFLQDMEKRLDASFLNTSAIQRDAERVTAEEIRILANELENTFGGIFSLLMLEIQLPMVKHRILRMQKAGELPRFPKGSTKVQIVAGLAALGRSSELERLTDVMMRAQKSVTPEAVAEYTNTGDLLQRFATAGGLDSKGLFKTEQQVQQGRQAANARELAGEVGSQVVKASSDQAIAAQQAATTAQPAS